MIQVNQLNYKIRGKEILKDINLSFEEGKIYGIIGPNGAGKSTLLKHMMRILEPKKDTIFYKQKDIVRFKVREYAQMMSFVFQENVRSIDFTVYEVLLMGRYTHMDLMGNISNDDEVLVEEVIQELQLEELRERSIATLSGGEAQKVFIGRAIVQNTPVILLDEPTSMLDIHNSVEIMELIKRIKEKHNLTIIMVLHDLNLAFHTCDEVILMEKGEVVSAGSKEALIHEGVLDRVYKNRLRIVEEEDHYHILPRFIK